MPFVTSSALNNLTVDGAFVYPQSPTPVAGQGIPTSLSGIVGTSSWGPLNTPVPFSDTASMYAAFGSYGACGQDPFSLVTEGQFAVAYSNNFLGVRVDNGASTAATAAIKDSGTTNGVTLTGLYTGATGNDISYSLQTGSASTSGAPTLTATIARLGYAPEVYPNLPNGATGGFAAALISAVNTGLPGVRGKSNLIVASVLGATSVLGFVATASPVSMTGGNNGAVVTSIEQIGVNGSVGSRTGIYALLGTGVQQFIMAGNSDSTQFAAQAAFAAANGTLAIAALPSGTTVAAAVTAKNTANYNSIYGVCLKDWVNFTDPSTGAIRLVSPLGVSLGVIASLPPEQSPGNKPVNGITNILSTEQANAYAQSDDQALEQAGIMYIRRGIERNQSLYGFWNGQNASTNWNSGTDTVAYTRMTNYLGGSIIGYLGPFVHELQSSAPNDQTRANAKAVLTGWLQGLQNAGRIAAYNVQLDNVINTTTTIADGLCLALVQVEYMAIIKVFLATLQGGQTLSLTTANTP